MNEPNVVLPPYDIQPGEWELTSRERELKASIAENRQKDAVIELLELIRRNYPIGPMYDQIQKLQAELAELRSLGGERWISVKQELPSNDSRIETIDMREPFPELTADHMGVNQGDLHRWQNTAPHFTHWRKVSPPSREKE
jgi:hypothetical protein